MQWTPSRRRFVTALSCAGVAGLFRPASCFALEPPETTTIRLVKNPGICIAPQYVANELLRAEGFTEVQHMVRVPADMSDALGRGEVDLSLHFAAMLIPAIDAGQPSPCWREYTSGVSSCLRMRASRPFGI